VIAPSFADIFYNNCFKNGILPLILPKEICEQLVKDAERGANATMTVDLEKQTVTRPDGEVVKFEMDPFRKHCLVNGLDEVGLTMTKGKQIEDYEAKLDRAQPWLAASGAR
jgi:3-isopropylmalate/(R)-2-methylmalate dehydratase small subunit